MAAMVVNMAVDMAIDMAASVVPFVPQALAIAREINAAINAVKANNEAIADLQLRVNILMSKLETTCSKVTSDESLLGAILSINKLLRSIRDYLTAESSKSLFFQCVANQATTETIEDFEVQLDKNLQILQTMLAAAIKEEQAVMHAKVDDIKDNTTKIIERLETLSVSKLRIIAVHEVAIDEAKVIDNTGHAKIHTAKWAQRSVAIKRLAISGPRAVAIIKADAEEWSKVNSPHILQLWGVCTDTDNPFLVMDLMKWSLHDYLATFDPLLARRVQLMLGIAEGIKYLHNQPTAIIHGDLNSKNVLINENQKPVLFNFGLIGNAKRIEAFGEIDPVWPEPESDQDAADSPTAADVYAFGMVCLEILFAKPGSPPPVKAVKKHLRKKNAFAEIPSQLAGIPADLWSLIKECASANADDRPSFRRIVERLRLVDQTIALSFDSLQSPSAVTSIDKQIESAMGGGDVAAVDALHMDATSPNLFAMVTMAKWFSGSLAARQGQIELHAPIKFHNGQVVELRLNDMMLGGSIPMDLAGFSALTALYLHGNSLKGPIPPEICNLVSLRSVSLADNALSGPIPDQIGNLVHLEELYLHRNQLSGPIPASIGKLTKITVLSAFQNDLSGSLPASLGDLEGLAVLNLGQNEISGEIPSALGYADALEVLKLDGNQLQGPVPRDLDRLLKLRVLDLSKNTLTGIPKQIGKLTRLTELNLSQNKIQGELLPEMLQNLVNLVLLDLSINKFSGDVPDTLGNLVNLVRVNLSFNQFTSLPDTIGNLTKTTYMNVRVNQISQIPETVGAMQQVRDLLIPFRLVHSIPASMGSLQHLTRLDMSRAKLFAPPSGLEHLTQLEELIMHQNKFKYFPREMRAMRNLRIIGLNYNRILYLPDWICELEKLTHLLLKGNQIKVIPHTIGQLSKLTEFDMRANQVLEVPPSITQCTQLRTLYLGINHIQSIPHDIGNLVNLTTIGISSNKIAALPPSFANLTRLQNMFMYSNKLTSMPDVSGMRELTMILMHDNRITELPPNVDHLANTLVKIIMDWDKITNVPASLLAFRH